MGKQATIDPGTVSGQLRMAIRDSGKTLLAISEASGVEAGVIARLITGDQMPSLETVDKLAAALGLRLSKAAAADDAAHLPLRESLSLTPEQQAVRRKDDDAYLAWLDTLDEWSEEQSGRRDENWRKRRELLIEWQQVGRDVQEMYMERLRRLNGSE